MPWNEFFTTIYYTTLLDAWHADSLITKRTYSLKRNSPGNAQEDKWVCSSHLHQFTIHWLSTNIRPTKFKPHK